MREDNGKRQSMDGMTALTLRSDDRDGQFEDTIDAICGMAWERLDNDEVLQVAKAYYYFSIQVRENLEIACQLHPADAKLASLREGECDTDNLSPWPKIAAPGEKMNHDEFMLRLLALQPTRDAEYLHGLGTSYLNRVRSVGERARACSIASYEDGGLSRVFAAMLRAPHWYGAGQRAFRHFLEQHILFDTDDAGGHGNLSRHLVPDASIAPLWSAFAQMLALAVPRLVQGPAAVATPRRSPAIAWPTPAVSA
jgi:hypothetical protein